MANTDAPLNADLSIDADAARAAASETPQQPGFGRRALLTSGAVGALLGAGGLFGARALREAVAPPLPGDIAAAEAIPSAAAARELPGFGGEALPCHGIHQAGIVTAPATHTVYAAFSLRPETDAAALKRMFRVLTGDVEGLTSGAGPLADPEVELAGRPARLTVTIGVGPELVTRVGAEKPDWLAPLPAFGLDQIGQGYDGGDLLVVLQADDQLPISHALRMLSRDLASFATPLWEQRGFRQARGAEPDNTTMRNLMGQVDGTVNPVPDETGFDDLIWLGPDAGWLAGGSAFVLRRIRMELDTWDMVDRPGREVSIGRRLADGSPLSAAAATATEHTPADFEATNDRGLPVIPMASHIRRAHSTEPSERIYRRAVNYDEAGESGLLFGCYQINPLRQFVPIQQRLDEADLLNEWVTHTGSAVFAMLPGFMPGERIGDTLFA